jgi:hypothetical protein
MSGPTFDFNNVFNQRISEAGKTRVIFINGGMIGDDPGIRNSWDKLDSSLNLSKSSWSPVDLSKNTGSVWFDPVVNPNKSHFTIELFQYLFEGIIKTLNPILESSMTKIGKGISGLNDAFSLTIQDLGSCIASLGNDPVDWNRIPAAIFDFQKILSDFVDPSLRDKVSRIQSAFSHFIENGVSRTIQEIASFTTSLGKDPVDLSPFQLSFQELQNSIVDFYSYFEEIFQWIAGLPNATALYLAKDKPIVLDYISNTLKAGDIESILNPIGSDIRELLTQYIYSDTSESRTVNKEWLQGDGSFWKKSSDQWRRSSTNIDDSVFSWLNYSADKDKNSIIFIPNSQGNFFVEGQFKVEVHHPLKTALGQC